MKTDYTPYKQKISFVHEQLQEKVRVILDKYYLDHEGINYNKLIKVAGGNIAIWKHYYTMDLGFIKEQSKKLNIPSQEKLENLLKHHGYKIRLIVEPTSL